MFREIRKKSGVLTEQECQMILSEKDTAVLSLIGEDDYPYGVPLNYIYSNGRIFIFSAEEGYKIDCMKKRAKASLTVIAKNESIQGKLSSNYESIIAFGQVKIIDNKEYRYNAFAALLERLQGSYEEKDVSFLEAQAKTTAIIEFVIEHISGKVNNENLA